jgi:modulator of FtsH protease
MQDKPIFNAQSTGVDSGASSAIQTNKVLRNTYMLLAMTLLFSAVTAAGSMMIGLGSGAALLMWVVSLGLLFFVLPRTENSASGIWVVFAVTGLLGASLGPMLSHYLSMANGPSLIMQSLAGTAIVFFGLSGYVLTTRKDFSFMGGFLMVGMMLAIVGIIANMFLQIPAMSLALSAGIVLIMSGFILFDTSRIINGGETNYIRATIGLYLSILNIFIHLLSLLGIMDD